MNRSTFVRTLCCGFVAVAGGVFSLSASAQTDAKPAGKPTATKKTIVIGVIAKSTSNPVFQAAKTGAEDAAADFRSKGIDVKVIWQTPTVEDAQKQSQYIEQLAGQGVDGITISCSDGKVLKSSIDAAVDRGVEVVTFDSDSPESKRFAYYGIDDVEAGRAVMRELAKAMGEKGGQVAVLAGNQTAPNLQARVKGVKEEMEKHKNIKLKQVYYHKETANDAAAMVQTVQTSNPDIAGWAMVGGWPLFTQNALDGVYDKAKVCSVDTLPAQLDYVRSGQVQALIGQDCYGWGYQTVVMLVDKIGKGKSPGQAVNHFELAVVTKENVEKYAGLWEKWLGGSKKDGEGKADPKPVQKK